MSQITEIIEEKSSVLIVSKKNNRLINLLKLQLIKYKADIFVSPQIPPNPDRFQYCFVINLEKLPKDSPLLKHKKLILVFINQSQSAKTMIKQFENSSIKIINFTGDTVTENIVDKIIWFSLSPSQEKYLRLNSLKKTVQIKTGKFKFNLRIPDRKKLIYLALLLFCFLH